MRKILAVEDSIKTIELIKLSLSGDYALDFATSFQEATALLQLNSYEIVLIDINLPDKSGINLVHHIMNSQQRHKPYPIILSAENDIQYKINAFTNGAIDYITKPFDLTELKLRVDIRLRRPNQDIYYLDEDTFIDYNLSNVYQVIGNQNIIIDLSPTEFRLLQIFVENQGSTLSRPQILNYLRGNNITCTDRTIDKHISSLRKKLAYASNIVSIYGHGYRLPRIEEQKAS